MMVVIAWIPVVPRSQSRLFPFAAAQIRPDGGGIDRHRHWRIAPVASSKPRPSTFSDDIDDGLGEGLRRFLGQIVPDAVLDGPVRILAREFGAVGCGVWMGCAIGIALKGDGGHRDHWSLG